MSDPSGWAAPEAPREDDPARARPEPAAPPGVPPVAPPAVPPSGPVTGWGPPPAAPAPPPGYPQAGYPQAGYGPPPGYPQAGYGPPPGHGPAGYGPPAYGPPAYGPPAYGPPGYAPPGYGPPGYGPPGGWQQPPRKPGIVPLRPLLFSEILDGAFQAMRTNPRTMIGIAAVVLAVTSLVNIPLQSWLQTSLGSGLASVDERTDPFAALDSLGRGLVASIPGMILLQLAVIVLEAMLVVAVSSAVLGRRTAPGELWRQVRGRILAAIVLAILTGLLVVVVVGLGTAVPVVPAVALIANDQAFPAFLLILLSIAVCLVLTVGIAVYTAVAAPALLLEGLGPVSALRRSVRLVRGSFWRTLGILVVAYLVTYLGTLVIGFPIGIISGVLDAVFDNPLHTQFWPNVASAAVSAIGETAGGAVLHPWWAAIIALVYIDLRMRREGLDLELIRAADAEERA